jgi:predicted transcriptional regulator
MTKPLLDVIFMSEKRKGVLLLLRDGAKEMEHILNVLETTRQALLPQIRILEDHYLVKQHEDTYKLTTLGKVIVDEISPVVGTIDVFDADIDYWGTRNLDFIPPYLLERMNELKDCEVITPPITELYSLHNSFNIGIPMSHSVHIITTFLYPNYQIFKEMLENDFTISYIVSQELLDKIRIDHQRDFGSLLKNENFKMYVYNSRTNFLFFAFNDVHLMMDFLKVTGEYDVDYVLCKSKNALEWGKDLFEYYLKGSTPITEI